MSAWESVALGDVATIDRNTVSPHNVPESTYYLGLEHIARGGDIVDSSTVGDAQLTSNKFHFDTRHILYGKLRPNLAKVANPAEHGICSTDILPILPGERLDRRYLLHYLRQPSTVSFASSRASGANLPRLSPTELSSFVIPLPPIDEQRRIASILDETDALRTKRRAQLANLDELPQSLFDEIASCKFKTATLAEIATLTGGGTLPSGEQFSGQTDGTLLLKVSDMNHPENRIFMRRAANWTDGKTLHSATLNSGAVVFPKRGAAIATNKKRITTRRSSLDPNLMGVSPNPDRLLTDYLFSWFQSFDLLNISSGSTVPQLNKKDLAPLLIPLPPLRIQQAFANKVTAIRAERDRVAKALDADEELFAALQHRAFRGEL